MNHLLGASYNLPQGATVKVFPRTAFPADQAPHGSPPASGEVFTDTMGASSLLVTGVVPATQYVAHALVGSTDRYVSFLTGAVEEGTLPSGVQDLSSSHAYTTTEDDTGKLLAVTAGSATATVTLVSAANAGDGAVQWVRKVDAGAGRVVVSDGTTDLAWLSAVGDTVRLRSNGTGWVAESCRIAPLEVAYTTPGAASVVIPPLAQVGDFTAIGAGGPGASGRRGAAGSVRTGGGGGSGGSVVSRRIPVSLLGTSPITAQVGTADTGGAAVAVDNTDGALGGNTSAARTTVTVGGVVVLRADAGGRGAVGNGTVAAAGGIPPSTGDAPNVAGGTSGVSGANAVAPVAAQVGSGAAGSSITAANGLAVGTAGGGGSGASAVTAGGAVGSAGGAGAAGTAATTTTQRGGGGGGGGHWVTGAASGAGGAGGAPGGGGGGGAASENGFASGAGGQGGRGELRVRWVF